MATDDLATKVATRILDQFQPAFTAGGQSIRVSACMGGARGLAGEKTPDQLVKDADFALRLAKSGKGRFEWYSPGMTASAPASEAADAA